MTLSRAAAAAIFVLVGLYWLGVGSGSRSGGGGFLALVLLVTCVSLGGVLLAFVGDRAVTAASCAVALALALFAAIGPWLLNDWIRQDDDRYIWVIHQGYPCGQMGAGPGMLWVFGTSWLAAFAAFAYAALSGFSALRVAAGIALGGALLGATAAAMFIDPAIFASVLGCI